MADTSLGFRYRGRMNGDSNNPTIQDILAADSVTYYKGDIVNLESGELDHAVTTDANIIGLVAETIAATDSTTYVRVYTDPDIILGVYDANARTIGATLDVSGSAGSMTVAASSGKEFVVFANSAADEETLVVFNRDVHAFAKAQ